MHIKILPFIVVMLFVLGCKGEKEKPKVSATSKTKEVVQVSKSEYEDLEGNAVSLSDYKGKRVLLNYWATWCRPCIEEMPDLLALQSSLAKENYVFLLASDQSIAKIQDFKAKRGFNFTFIKYNGAYADQQISALPVTLVYNEAGEQVKRFTGAMSWNTPQMIEQLKNIQ